jgi:putative endonuclease
VDKDEVWRRGEQLAAEHLLGKGWTILDRNWRCAAGEIDIVAVEPGREPTVVFCEVKCRTGLSFGTPLEAITGAKLGKLRELALHWLRAQEHPTPSFRIDAIGVLLSPDGPRLTHLLGLGR